MPQADRGRLAIADVYAEALQEAAREVDEEQEVASQFGDLLTYMDGDPDLEVWLANPSIDTELRAASLERMFRGQMHDLLLNALQVLNNRRRGDLIRAVQRALQLRMETQREQQEIVVETAVPLWHEMRTAIRAVAGSWLRKTVILIERVRPELLGGMVIHAGDIQVDGSVQSRIEALRRRLQNRTTYEVHAGERYLEESSE